MRKTGLPPGIEIKRMKALYYSKKLKKLIVPENWNELTGRQLIKISALLNEGIKSPELACDKALKILCNKSLFSFWMIPLETRMNAHEHIAFVFEEQNLIKQLIPCYDGLYGPD